MRNGEGRGVDVKTAAVSNRSARGAEVVSTAAAGAPTPLHLKPPLLPGTVKQHNLHTHTRPGLARLRSSTSKEPHLERGLDSLHRSSLTEALFCLLANVKCTIKDEQRRAHAPTAHMRTVFTALKRLWHSLVTRKK